MPAESDAGGPAPLVLPLPFCDRPWPERLRTDARAIWEWHLHVSGSQAGDAWRPEDVDAVAAGEELAWVPSSVSGAAYAACEHHGLSRSLLADQVSVAPRLWAPTRFSDAAALDEVIRAGAGSHAQLLAGMAKAAHSWQVPWVVEFARGLFLTGCLVRLPHDVRWDRLFVPLADLEQSGVTEAQLRQGRVDAAMRRLLWKQAVRARDALARGTPLAAELAPRYGRVMRRWWMDALEVLNEVERRDFDLWSTPLSVSPFRRIQARLLARFGRTTFRRR